MQMARQEGDVTEKISQGSEGHLTKNKESRVVLDRPVLCKDASIHLSRFCMFFFSCIISSSDDRIESLAILGHCLLAYDYGFSVLLELIDAAQWCLSKECYTKVRAALEGKIAFLSPASKQTHFNYSTYLCQACQSTTRLLC